MIYTKKIIIIICCIILGVILLINFLYNKFVKNTNNIELFENAIDLVNKYKSSEVNNIHTDSASETSIYPWTTILQNIDDNNKIRAIGLYKPNVVLNGVIYSKLGDMLSLNSDFSQPLKTDFTLLVVRNSSDIKPPIGYNLIVNFGNNNLESFYTELQDKLDNTNINAMQVSLNNCFNYDITLQNIINNNKQLIHTNVINLITLKTFLSVNINASINLSTILENQINDIRNTISFSINNNSEIHLPVGIDVSITSGDGKYDITWNNNNVNLNNIKLNSNANFNSQINKLSNNFSNIPDNNKFKYTSIQNINIFKYVQPEIILYLQNICNDIINIYNNTKNTKLLDYLKLASDITQVKTLLQTLSQLSSQLSSQYNNDSISPDLDIYTNTNTGSDLNFSETPLYIKLSEYKNINTLLGNIITLILSNSNNYYYCYVIFTPSQLVFSSTSITNTNTEMQSATLIQGTRNQITYADNLIINNSKDNLNTIFNNITYNINNDINTSIIRNFKPPLHNLLQIQNAMSTRTIDFFPLKIYEPIAPPNYISVGHIFCNTEDDLNKVKLSNNVACIPQQCIRNIREWVASDKVFEYNKNNIYWALYKNPYIGTFISVNNPQQLPPGKVCKVVACVAKCTAIDELTKADNCARKYQQINKSIMNNITQAPDLVASAEEQIYLQKIKQQSDNITRLKNRAQQMQISMDKAGIVNEEMNKSKLQNYVDTQQRNIEMVVNKLENDNNNIKTNINMPLNAINNVINVIKNTDTLSQIEKDILVNKIITTATNLSNNTISETQYNIILNKILKSSPQYDMTGLVLKDLVADVCYGCGTPD